MNVATIKKLYSRHAYSGPRKNLNRVRGALRRFHDSDSRLKVWRSGETKTPVNEEILIDNSKVNHSTQLRTYARAKPKLRIEATCSAPSTSTAVTAEPEDSPQSENEIKEDSPQSENEIKEDSPQSENEINEDSLRSENEINEDSPQSENEIEVFCPKCDTDLSHIAKGIQEDQTKILIAKVYHYFEQEYEELKTIYGDLDLTPLSKFRQRTALATGVSETTVLQILKEEEGRNADKRQEPPEKRSARKRSRETDSSSEGDSPDDNVDNNEQSRDVHEAQTVVVVESPEYYNEEPEIYVPLAVLAGLNKELAQTDPIRVDVKTEPDVVDNTNETLALNEPVGTKRRARTIPRSDVTATCTNETLALNEPVGTKRRARTIPRSDVTATRTNETLALNEPVGTKRRARKIPRSDVTATRTNETLALNEPAGTKRRARKITRSDVTSTRSSLFGVTEIEADEIEIHEEGPS